jgi:hypothetical protein
MKLINAEALIKMQYRESFVQRIKIDKWQMVNGKTDERWE